ncbi:MAG: phosphoribosylformylglycinamidine cyclo-ligase, partial [Helicobacter sp.]|nr:phosphoribosylformylglycinamidine cyclo-ligase [Helicobacter sp.]
GLIENIPRILPYNVDAIIEEKKIQTLPIFEWLTKYIVDSDKYRTFNMGIGMVLVCDCKEANTLAKLCNGYILGEIKQGNKSVKFA